MDERNFFVAFCGGGFVVGWICCGVDLLLAGFVVLWLRRWMLVLDLVDGGAWMMVVWG